MVDQLDEGVVQADEGQPMQRRPIRRLLVPNPVDRRAKPAHRCRIERVLDDQVALAFELGKHIREYEPQARSGPCGDETMPGLLVHSDVEAPQPMDV